MSVEMVTIWCAVLFAAGAVWSLHRQDDALRRARLMFADSGRVTAKPGIGIRGRTYGVSVRAKLTTTLGRGRARLEGRFGRRIGYEALCVPVGLAAALMARSPVPVVAGLVAVPCVARQLRERERRLAAELWEEAVAGLCSAVAGELRAGRPPEAVLVEALERVRAAGGLKECDAVLTPVLAAARFGGNVPAALRQAARGRGAEGLAGAAACWETAIDGGAGLAEGLDRVAAALRAERDQRDDLRAQLAGPRSTAFMLALLPVFGLLLGTALGADPLGVLLRTPAGLGCLLSGAALEWAGVVWTTRIVREAEGAS